MQDLREQTKHSKDDTDKDPYPLEGEKDTVRNMAEKETLQRTINLSEACVKFYLNTERLSYLRNEIGLFPNIDAKLELTDKKLFYIKPFPINKDDKIIADGEMKAVC